MRRALLAVLAMACVASVAGCGGAVAPRTWAGSVCRSLAPWRAQIAALNTKVTHEMDADTTPAQARDYLTGLLRGAADATERARAAVEAAGVPDVEGGAEIERRYVAALAKVRDAYRRADTTIAGLDTGDPDRFYAAVGAAMATLNADYQASGVDTGSLVSDELQADFNQVAACN
jgi:hypothetical protein